MNNRFNFRAWDKKANHYLDSFYIMPDESKVIYSSAIDEDEVVIEQCTGLKDKSGKLIYEGDVLNGGVINYQVLWYEGKFVLKNGCKNYPAGGCDLLELVGNIHENPELLGKARKND